MLQSNTFTTMLQGLSTSIYLINIYNMKEIKLKKY